MSLISSKIPALIQAIKHAVLNPSTSELNTDSQSTIDTLLSSAVSDTLIAKGQVTYANDAAAATAGIPIGGYYVTTTTGVVHARLV